MPSNMQLRQELLAMEAADRKLRAELDAAGELGDGYQPRMKSLHVANAARLREIIAEHGWPARSVVGEDGTDAAWLILQHSISEPQFMRGTVALLEKSVAAGETPAWHLAYLTDRIACFEGRPQRYGTQWDVDEDGTNVLEELESPEHVDELRKSVGLWSLSERVGPEKWPAVLLRRSSAKRQHEFDRWAREMGWRK
jgi:hypothetical protein